MIFGASLGVVKPLKDYIISLYLLRVKIFMTWYLTSCEILLSMIKVVDNDYIQKRMIVVYEALGIEYHLQFYKSNAAIISRGLEEDAHKSEVIPRREE